MPLIHVTTQLLPDPTCCYAPPAPPLGGGGRARRRLRRPVWGVAPIATDPDVWAAGPPRRRLSNAARMTSVMGVVWVGSSALPGSFVSAPDALDAAIHRAVPAESTEASDDTAADVPMASPIVFQRGGGGGHPDTGDEPLHAARIGSAEAAPAPAEAAAETPWHQNVIARYGDVDIIQPSEHVEMVGFHEGGSRASDVTPAATPDEDHGVKPVVSERRDDPLPTMVLPGRDRGTGAASAIDVAMPEGREVQSPITGTVTAANEYALYGKHPDTIITIEPDGHPEVELEVLHVVDAQVQVGDRVEAGKTVLARSANLLPFPSQIDRFVDVPGGPLPHVHLELQRVG